MTYVLSNSIFDFDIAFWVFVPVFNFEQYLEECICSLYNQTYKKYNVVLINDASTDRSQDIIDNWVKKFKDAGIEVYLITNKKNMGPAYTKWQAIQFVRENANLNDIFTIVDGDDFFCNKSALELIFQKYLTSKCLFTYGSAIGEYNEKVEMVKDISSIRNPNTKFLYQHPRSCLVYLLHHFLEGDFQDRLGNWLIRVTDRQFIFKCIELAGLDRVSIIEPVIYNYRSHSGNIRNKVNNEYKKEIERHIAATSSNEVLKEEIHIVMCCYRRHHNLKEIIGSICNQTINVLYSVNLHIINTNPDKWEDTQRIKGELNAANSNLKLHLCNTTENLYGYARFLYVRHTMKKCFMPYVIFIDDDQVLAKDWVEKMYSTRKPLTYNCWYGRIFEKGKGIDAISYWNDLVMQHKRLLAEYDPAHKEFDYGGTGGSIIDTNVFSLDLMFRCPKHYRNIEDLWLSFIMKHVLGTSIGIVVNPINAFSFRDSDDTAIWTNIMQEKEDFLKVLCKTGFCFSDSININELEKIIEKGNDSDSSISRFMYA